VLRSAWKITSPGRQPRKVTTVLSRSTTQRRYPERTDEFRIAPPGVGDYLTSERCRESSPTTRGMTIQIIVVEASIAHSLPVFVAPSRSATCV
jgi:hypothetical protein